MERQPAHSGILEKKMPFASYFCHKPVFACNSFGQLQLRLEGVGHRPTALTFARHRRCVHFLGDEGLLLTQHIQCHQSVATPGS